MLPKIELHVHLDCCLSYSVVKRFVPQLSQAEFRRDYIAPPKADLPTYLACAVRGFALMQTAEQLRWVTLDLLEQLQADGVIYAELRFAPLQHLQAGLDAVAVVEIVTAAVAEGCAQYGLEARLLLCTLRHYTEAQSLATLALVEQFQGQGVVGFDLAADEAGYPLDEHLSAFALARAKGIPCTAHAGEARGPESVWETLEKLKPQRLGHGVRSMEDANLVAFLRERDIHLEICPSSNLKTGVFARIEAHSLHALYLAGVSLSLNTDGRTISDTDLGREYALVQDTFGWTKADLMRCNLEAIRHAFIDEPLKATLRVRIEEGYR